MQNYLRSKGILLVLSSPSGAGKSSLAKQLLLSEKNLAVSTSYTTRPPRLGEIDGQDYFFTDTVSFRNMIERDEFIEYAEVYGNYYGTPKMNVNKLLQEVSDVIFDIDWQGARNLKNQMPEDVVSVYILPPSMEELHKRLTLRSQDSAEVVNLRMSKAREEMKHYVEYDYVIINDDFDQSLHQLQSILQAERVKRHRQYNLFHFVESFAEEDL